MAEAVQLSRHSFSLAIVRSADRALLGSCATWVESQVHSRGALGFAIARQHWGQGYATEAARAILVLVFTELGLDRVEATCRPDNTGSRRVLEKLGMQQEG